VAIHGIYSLPDMISAYKLGTRKTDFAGRLSDESATTRAKDTVRRRRAMKTPVIAAAMVALFATPALADTRPFDAREPISIRVSTADLNLSSPRDRQRLEKRMERAILAACNPVDRRTIDPTPDDQCHSEATANARPMVERMALRAAATRISQN
jgi:UrcA family protein